MNRVAAVLVAVVVLAGSVPAAAAPTQPGSDDVEPGAALAGVVGVQQAEVDNEVAERSLSQQFAAADSNATRAQIVADQQRRLSERLDALEAEKQRIEQDYEDGNMSRGEYRARLAALGAELRAVERRANRTVDEAASLPAQALRERGVNVSRLRTVATQANRTGGGDVAEAARAIGGRGVGQGLRGPPNASERGPPDDRGPEAGPANETGNGTVGGPNGPPEGGGTQRD